MATEIVTKQWCDICLRERDQRVEATFSDQISVGPITRNMDLCDEDFQDLIGDLPVALEKYGSPATDLPQQPMRVQQRGDQITCPICGRPYQYRNSLASHVLSAHEISLRELETGTRGKTYPCDQPGCDFVARGGQGLGAHKKHAHGIEGVSTTAARVRQNQEDALV